MRSRGPIAHTVHQDPPNDDGVDALLGDMISASPGVVSIGTVRWVKCPSS